MIVRKLEGASFLESLKLSSICFDYPFDTDGKEEMEYVQYLRSSNDNKALNDISATLGVFSDKEELMSCFCMLPFEFYFDGNTVKANGIGNVCTYPQHRRKGAIRELFKDAFVRMYENGDLFSYLYPFNESFYNHFGYYRTRNSTCYKWNLKALPKDKPSGSFHLYGMDAEPREFEEAYARFASGLNLMVKRDCMDWRNLKDAKGAANNNYAYLYKDQQGVPKGYLIIKGVREKAESYLSCREIVFDSRETLQALLSFAGSYANDYNAIRLHTPSYMNLDAFCSDYTLGNTSVTHAFNGMVRVVNAQKVLLHAAYRGSGSVSIKLSDTYIKENEGTYLVEYESGRAKSVVKTSAREADIIMPIDIFSSAITGDLSPEDFRWLSGCEISCKEDKLGEIFYRKQCFINNYF